MPGHELGNWICGFSLFYKRELWTSKSAGAHSTKSLKICGCKRWCPKDLRVRAPPAAPVLTHSLLNSKYGHNPYHRWLIPTREVKCSCGFVIAILINSTATAGVYCIYCMCASNLYTYLVPLERARTWQAVGQNIWIAHLGQKLNVPILQLGLIVRYHCVLEKRSLDWSSLGQCYSVKCNFAKNSTKRVQYYVICGSKIVT